jgi:hypothetical protein
LHACAAACILRQIGGFGVNKEQLVIKKGVQCRGVLRVSALASLAAYASLSPAALGQLTPPTSAEYELRLITITPDNEVMMAPRLRFWVQARARTAVGTTNYGINRWQGSISITADAATVSRATSSSATNFGRFRAPSPIGNFAAGAPAAPGTNTASGNAAAPGGLNDANGRISSDQQTITGIDAYRGLSFNPIAGTDPVDSPLGNPFASSVVTDGSWSAWATLYAFNVDRVSFPFLVVRATGTVTTMTSVGFQNVNGGQWIATELPMSPPLETGFLLFPSPGTAALLGVAGVVAMRRRR